MNKHNDEVEDEVPEWQVGVAGIIHDAKLSGESHAVTTKKILDVVLPVVNQQFIAGVDAVVEGAERMKPCYGDARPSEIEMAEFDGYNLAIKDIKDHAENIKRNID